MTKVGLIQTRSYENNKKGIENISKILERLGKTETEIVCLPEQWLPNNQIENYDQEFFEFKKIARNYSMTVIPGAFYEKNENTMSINSPIIGPEGEIIGKQEKIHPYEYEKETVSAGTEAKIFKTSCKFGIMICYDTVFPGVADMLTKKGAQMIFSPSRIVKEGIEPWKMYVQVRSLENRIPIIAPNVEDIKFGGSSLIVELTKEGKIVKTRITELKGECEESVNITFSNYELIRKQRIEDRNNFSITIHLQQTFQQSAFALTSEVCSIGCFIKYALAGLIGPPIFRSRAIFANRIASITIPAELALSSTSKRTSMLYG